MKTLIETIPHKEQSYPTIGDWEYVDEQLVIKVSKLNNFYYESLIAIHELIEAILCKRFEISQLDVDIWDKNYEGEGEPGEDPKCPYYTPHLIATMIEQQMCMYLRLDWLKYEEIVKAALESLQ